MCQHDASSVPWTVYLEDGAPFEQIAARLVGRHGMERVSERERAGCVLLEESTAQRILRTQARGGGFHDGARVVYLPGMLYIEDKCRLAKLLRGASYHPETYVDELPAGAPTPPLMAGRWIEKLGLGANGANVRILPQAPLAWKKKGYVLQRYEEDVMLLDGRKFDLRVHAILLADGRFAIHEDAVVRRCAKRYSTQESDPASQITNMSVQRSYDATLGSVTGRLSLLPRSMQDSLRSAIHGTVADALHRFSACVRSADDALGARMMADGGTLFFRMFGFDVLPMADGSVRLLEANYRPAINTAGAVGPFYRDLIDWMVNTLMRVDTPQLTLPLDAPSRDGYVLCPSIAAHVPRAAVPTTRPRAQNIVARFGIAGHVAPPSSTILLDAEAAAHFAALSFGARAHPDCRRRSRLLVPAASIRDVDRARGRLARWVPTWIVLWPAAPTALVAFTCLSGRVVVAARGEIAVAWFGCARARRSGSAPTLSGVEFEADPRWARGHLRSVSTRDLRLAAQALWAEDLNPAEAGVDCRTSPSYLPPPSRSRSSSPSSTKTSSDKAP